MSDGNRSSQSCEVVTWPADLTLLALMTKIPSLLYNDGYDEGHFGSGSYIIFILGQWGHSSGRKLIIKWLVYCSVDRVSSLSPKLSILNSLKTHNRK